MRSHAQRLLGGSQAGAGGGLVAAALDEAVQQCKGGAGGSPIGCAVGCAGSVLGGGSVVGGGSVAGSGFWAGAVGAGGSAERFAL